MSVAGFHAARSPGRAGPRARLAVLAVLLCLPVPARADDFVDVLASKVWAHKGGLACDKADDAASGATGFFSSCVRLPIALRVKLVDTPEPMTRVYRMRVLDSGERPKFAWFSRESLTNNPKPDEFVPDP